jgi:hypothetical protein
MNEIRCETRNSLGIAGRLAIASLLLGAAGLLTAPPASAGGLLGGGAGAGASAGVGGSQGDADAQAGSSSSVSANESKSVDVRNDTKLGVGAVADVGKKVDAELALGAESATGLSISRSHPSSSDDDADSSETSASAAAGGDRRRRDGEQ